MNHPGQLGLRVYAGWEMSTGQGAVTVLLAQEDNRRSGFALSMCHRLWYIDKQT